MAGNPVNSVAKTQDEKAEAKLQTAEPPKVEEVKTIQSPVSAEQEAPKA